MEKIYFARDNSTRHMGMLHAKIFTNRLLIVKAELFRRADGFMRTKARLSEYVAIFGKLRSEVNTAIAESLRKKTTIASRLRKNVK